VDFYLKGPELAAEQLAASRLGSLVRTTGMVITSSNCPCPVTFVSVLRSSIYTMPPGTSFWGAAWGTFTSLFSALGKVN
jgi:hypothetical protein